MVGMDEQGLDSETPLILCDSNGDRWQNEYMCQVDQDIGEKMCDKAGLNMPESNGTI